jgi:uncharacterized membrane protein
MQLSIPIIPPSNATLGDYGFTVNADEDSNTDYVQGDLVVAGSAPAVDPNSHGVVLSLTPAQATAGQGTATQYVVQLTNTGSDDETFDLAATLPAGVAGVFTAGNAVVTSIDVPPGVSNFRDVTLTLTLAVGTASGTDPFTVTATSTPSSTTGMTTGSLVVVGNGVSVTLDKSSGAPGDTFMATVTNTGTATDTFDLAPAGPAGLVATLGQSR